MSSTMDLETEYCAHNYHRVPVVLTRGAFVRLAPPLIIERAKIDWAVTRIRDLLNAMNEHRPAS